MAQYTVPPAYGFAPPSECTIKSYHECNYVQEVDSTSPIPSPRGSLIKLSFDTAESRSFREDVWLLLFNECACALAFSSSSPLVLFQWTFLWHSSKQTANQPTCLRRAACSPHHVCLLLLLLPGGGGGGEGGREGPREEGVYLSPADVPNANRLANRKRFFPITQPRSQITLNIFWEKYQTFDSFGFLQRWRSILDRQALYTNR